MKDPGQIPGIPEQETTTDMERTSLATRNASVDTAARYRHLHLVIVVILLLLSPGNTAQGAAARQDRCPEGQHLDEATGGCVDDRPILQPVTTEPPLFQPEPTKIRLRPTPTPVRLMPTPEPIPTREPPPAPTDTPAPPPPTRPPEPAPAPSEPQAPTEAAVPDPSSIDEEGAIVTIAAWMCPGTSTLEVTPEDLATTCTEPVPGVGLELASNGAQIGNLTTDNRGQATLDPARTGDLSIVPRPPDGYGFGFASVVIHPDGPDGDTLPPVVSASPSGQVGWAVEPGSLSLVDLFIFELDDAAANGVLIEHYLCDAPMDSTMSTLEAMVAACSPTTSPGTGFTIPSSLGVTYQVATPSEDTDPAFAQFTYFPYVPPEPVAVARDLVAGHEQSLAWCRWHEMSNTWAGTGDGELGAVPVDSTGTMTLLVNAANPFTVDDFHCFWFSYPDENGGYQPPHLVPNELPIQVLCDRDAVQTGIETTCAQELPEGMQLCSLETGNQRQVTNCVPDVIAIPEATALSAGTSRITMTPVLCASHSGPDPQTIQEAETACEPRQNYHQTPAPVYLASMTLSVSGWTQQGNLGGKACCWIWWEHVPEGTFTTTRDAYTYNGDPFEFDGESAVFCSWEAQFFTQNGPEYAVAYDIRMTMTNHDVFTGAITYPGTDMTCRWYNYPDPERADLSNDPVPQPLPTEMLDPALQPVEDWHPPEPVIPGGNGEQHPPEPVEPDPSGD